MHTIDSGLWKLYGQSPEKPVKRFFLLDMDGKIMDNFIEMTGCENSVYDPEYFQAGIADSCDPGLWSGSSFP